MDQSRGRRSEFNTFQNGNNAGHSDDGVSVQTSGALPTSDCEIYSRGYVPPNANTSDESSHTVRVLYDNPNLSVYLDDMDAPILEVSADIGQLLHRPDGKTWVGVTAATAGSTPYQYCENHDILSWSFAPEPAMAALLSFAVSLLVGSRGRKCSGARTHQPVLD